MTRFFFSIAVVSSIFSIAAGNQGWGPNGGGAPNGGGGGGGNGGGPPPGPPQYEPICRFNPMTKVTDENAMDLDQVSIMEHLRRNEWPAAKSVYEAGGHSMSVAHLTLVAPEGPAHYPAGSKVYGPSHDQQGVDNVRGTLMADASWDANAEGKNLTIIVRYDTLPSQQNYVGCRVGDLSDPEVFVDGCFDHRKRKVQLVAPGEARNGASLYKFTYSLHKGNVNYRTFQGFSLNASRVMKPCATCDYPEDFKTFTDYYGTTEYADYWVGAALRKEDTRYGLGDGRGEAAFTSISDEGQASAVVAGTVVLHSFMEVLNELEDAAASCEGLCADKFDPGDSAWNNTCEEYPIHALDKAVAYYCGSRQGPTGSGNGVMLFELAQKRAKDFQTAGENKDKRSGVANVNGQIMSQFERMQNAMNNQQCNSVVQHYKMIRTLIKIPLIQSTLRLAYVRNFEDREGDNYQQERERAEGAGSTYAAAILPFIYKCNKDDARIIYNNMKVGTQQVSFDAVKKAFERNYQCLEIGCDDVGGLMLDDSDEYVPGGEPCGYQAPATTNGGGNTGAPPPGTGGGSNTNPASVNNNNKKNGGAGTAMAILGLTMLAVVGSLVGYRFYQNRKYAKRKADAFRPSPTNIAAVSEIA